MSADLHTAQTSSHNDPASSDSEQPIDKLIIKKANQRAATSSDADSRPSMPGRAQQALHKQQAKSMTAAAGAQPKPLTLGVSDGPVGVVVIDEGDISQRNLEMQKLLRVSRYFDEVYQQKGAVSCWRCGVKGHLAKDCTNKQEKPCVLCAQYGHESSSCPHSTCSRADCVNAGW